MKMSEEVPPVSAVQYGGDLFWCSLTGLAIAQFVAFIFHSFIRSFLNSFIRSFAHSFIQSIVHSSRTHCGAHVPSSFLSSLSLRFVPSHSPLRSWSGPCHLRFPPHPHPPCTMPKVSHNASSSLPSFYMRHTQHAMHREALLHCV